MLLEPSRAPKFAADGVAACSHRLVVKPEAARRIPEHRQSAEPDKLAVMPHEIPDLPGEDPEAIKREHGLRASRPVGESAWAHATGLAQEGRLPGAESFLWPRCSPFLLVLEQQR